MEKLDNRALTRFERLLGKSKVINCSGLISPSAVKDGEIYPMNYCISLPLPRLIQQPHGAEVVCGIRNHCQRLFEAADLNLLSDESLHVSWMYARKNTNVFEHAQINKIKHICIKIEKERAGRIILRGIRCGKSNFLFRDFLRIGTGKSSEASLGEEFEKFR